MAKGKTEDTGKREKIRDKEELLTTLGEVGVITQAQFRDMLESYVHVNDLEDLVLDIMR